MWETESQNTTGKVASTGPIEGRNVGRFLDPKAGVDGSRISEPGGAFLLESFILYS
jgi:hypothetical protein